MLNTAEVGRFDILLEGSCVSCSGNTGNKVCPVIRASSIPALIRYADGITSYCDPSVTIADRALGLRNIETFLERGLGREKAGILLSKHQIDSPV